ncbi:MAG: Gfo/Idh/MocA family oxidoreductase [bacterium]|nr:Gfo/Idh/MocA family oxidoreductase [bacterium]
MAKAKAIVEKEINWGIIGCGAVTEVKSGPAFNRPEGSRVAAVMRRNGAAAADYARRHKVPAWYDDAEKLIVSPAVNAVYIATPPASHAEYAIKAANAGKHVYVEKPMAVDYDSCLEMIRAAEANGVKLFVAYYRRALPYFIKIKELLDSGCIGLPRLVSISMLKPPPREPLDPENLPWRFKKEIAGGGLFVDLGSHQLDILDFLLGPIVSVNATVANQAELYPVEDIICANFSFQPSAPSYGVGAPSHAGGPPSHEVGPPSRGSGPLGTASWCFTAPRELRRDTAEIVGSHGRILFSIFDMKPILVETEKRSESFAFDRPQHIQEHFIGTIVDELTGRGPCPGRPADAARTTKVMDTILAGFEIN